MFALQTELGGLEDDDLAAVSEQEALATSLAAVLSTCADQHCVASLLVLAALLHGLST